MIVDVDDLHTVLQAGTAGADIGWLEAQSEVAAKGKNPVVVAVIDSGIDPTHPDLLGQVMALGGHDFLQNHLIQSDDLGHGTFISGIIAADSNNGAGVTGVAPSSVKIMPIRAMWSTNDSNSLNHSAYIYNVNPPTSAPNYRLLPDIVADAVNFAVSRGATIINLSLGWPRIYDTTNAALAIHNARKAGVLVVVASGNDNKDKPVFPCSYEGVICVGSITNTGALSFYSNHGGMVDILAPGDGIISTFPRNLDSESLDIQGYEMDTGTSFATPMVVGVAATVKSIYPNISADELEARLYLSASAIPVASAGLYGNVNLKKAIDALPQPVYHPEFKNFDEKTNRTEILDELPVDEDTLQVHGNIPVKNLWAAATGVQVEVSVNGKNAGSAQADQLGSGGMMNVPWTYQFASLDESSDLNIVLHVSDSSGTAKDFAIRATAVRDMSKIKSTQVFAVPQTQAGDWVGQTSNGTLVSRVNTVDNYPREAGAPRYFEEYSTSNYTDGDVLNIYDPSTSALMTQVKVPGIRKIQQVVRIDLAGDGKKDWVIVGFDQDPQGRSTPANYCFYFLDSNFQPFYGSISSSLWQIKLSNTGGQNPSQNYALAGSWIQSGGKLLPSFLGTGTRPAKDNFSELDIRHYGSAPHFYYWSPLPAVAGSANQNVQLELRALDNVAFQEKYPNAIFQNIIPGSPADMTAGHVRILVTMGSDLNSATDIWDLKSITDTQMVPAANWDAMVATGSPYYSLGTGNSNAFLSFFDTARGTLVWSDKNGNFVDRSEFTFSSPENPIEGLVGAFDVANLGHFWFVQSAFNLVGFHEAGKGNSPIQMQSLPLDRETSLGDQFNSTMSPVLVGSNADPLPGVFLEMTTVRGHHAEVAVWDSSSGKMLKPLRYSLSIPSVCLDMTPVQLTSDSASFALPLICVQPKTNSLQVQLVQPTAQ